MIASIFSLQETKGQYDPVTRNEKNENEVIMYDV